MLLAWCHTSLSISAANGMGICFPSLSCLPSFLVAVKSHHNCRSTDLGSIPTSSLFPPWPWPVTTRAFPAEHWNQNNFWNYFTGSSKDLNMSANTVHLEQVRKKMKRLILDSNHGLDSTVALLISRHIELICQAACFVVLVWHVLTSRCRLITVSFLVVCSCFPWGSCAFLCLYPMSKAMERDAAASLVMVRLRWAP